MSVSVLVATYGDDGWRQLAWRRAVSSVQSQTLDVIPWHEPNGTVASSRNAAAEWSDGEWLLFLDADDEIAPGYIGAMERALKQQGPDGNSRLLLTPAVQVVRRGRPGTPSFFREVPLRDGNWLVVGTLVHRDLFWEVGGFDDHPHGYEDWALWSKCVRAGASVVKVPDAVYRYHANPQSKHRRQFRDRKWHNDTHARVVAELDEWEAARAPAA